MGTYGRNFDFRTPPVGRERGARFVLEAGADIPIGAPVVAAANPPETVSDFTDAIEMQLATTAQPPVKGISGIAVYEWIHLDQLDPQYYTYSDRDVVPAGKLFQVVSGPGIKVVFTNTEDREFLHGRDYAGRLMVAGAGATPTVAVGELLTPGVGTDEDGYWAETGTASNGWLRVTNVDTDRGDVEAVMLF